MSSPALAGVRSCCLLELRIAARGLKPATTYSLRVFVESRAEV
jgi:hypothetical protein